MKSESQESQVSIQFTYLKLVFELINYELVHNDLWIRENMKLRSDPFKDTPKAFLC